jgi:hypothetical protein
MAYAFQLRRVFDILTPANEKSKVKALDNLPATCAFRVWMIKVVQRASHGTV